MFFWLLVVWNPAKTIGLKGKGQRLGVMTKRLGAYLGYRSRDRIFAAVKQDAEVAPDIVRANHSHWDFDIAMRHQRLLRKVIFFA